MLELSILIISRNIENLKLLFSSLPDAVSDLKYEVICAWNGDEFPEDLIYKQSLPIRVLLLKPYHFSKNNNYLANQARGKALLFLNDDMQVDKNAISTAVTYLNLHHDTGIVGANLRYPSELIQHAGVFINEKLNPYHYLKNSCHYQDPRISVTREVPAVTGAFILMLRSEFLAVTFDEQCEVAAQDIILCFRYREFFQKKVVYLSTATAIHFENKTRKLFDQKLTPPKDLKRMESVIMKNHDLTEVSPKDDSIRLRVITEKPGWIMYRKGAEICKRLKNAKINEDYSDANIHYYINYGFFRTRPKSGIVVANFTHLDPNLHHDKWVQVANEADHCIAVSQEAANNISKFGIPDNKISVIKVGADISFKPCMTIGVVGRLYPGGRKGEHLVEALLNDASVMENMKIISTNDTWGLPVHDFEDMADFYRSIDYLLIPALIEGGPVPFMEALACGTLSIAPPIGVVPEFPHIEYKTGDIESLKQVIIQTKKDFMNRKNGIANYMANYNWSTWAYQHIELFKRLIESS